MLSNLWKATNKYLSSSILGHLTYNKISLRDSQRLQIWVPVNELVGYWIDCPPRTVGRPAAKMTELFGLHSQRKSTPFAGTMTSLTGAMQGTTTPELDGIFAPRTRSCCCSVPFFICAPRMPRESVWSRRPLSWLSWKPLAIYPSLTFGRYFSCVSITVCLCLCVGFVDHITTIWFFEHREISKVAWAKLVSVTREQLLTFVRATPFSLPSINL